MTTGEKYLPRLVRSSITVSEQFPSNAITIIDLDDRLSECTLGRSCLNMASSGEVVVERMY
jgi:hypothetical protein